MWPIDTGSAGAIGKAVAECFATAGVKLVLVYNRTQPAAKEHFAGLGAADVLAVQCNVAELPSCQDLVRQVTEAFGTVDILVNNAGANGLEPPPESFIYDLAVNLHGPYYLMRLLMPAMRTQRSGCVLNITSRAGVLSGVPFSTSYHASKAALINLTGCVQSEADVDGLDDVHLYALHPGGVRSEMTLNKYKNALETLPDHPDRAAKLVQRVDNYNDSPYLNGMVCVALATGLARHVLRGRYFDVGQDLEDVLALAGDAIKADPELYTLHTRYLGSVPDGGAVLDEPFNFPGF
ncbi:NADP-binding protein [Apiospora kogelbergensis]|uniref:NADP-binding protein n=1 Tax=Apiospora kogelbergensis TaxID=1337665 RepID=A0AAW0R3Q5_9PEZI